MTSNLFQVDQAEVIKERTVGSGSVPHRVLDAAHDMLDHYLPEGRRDLQESGGCMMVVVVKLESLFQCKVS